MKYPNINAKSKMYCFVLCQLLWFNLECPDKFNEFKDPHTLRKIFLEDKGFTSISKPAFVKLWAWMIINKTLKSPHAASDINNHSLINVQSLYTYIKIRFYSSSFYPPRLRLMTRNWPHKFRAFFTKTVCSSNLAILCSFYYYFLARILDSWDSHLCISWLQYI